MVGDLSEECRQNKDMIKNKDKRYSSKIKEVFDYFEGQQQMQTELLHEAIDGMTDDMDDLTDSLKKKVAKLKALTSRKIEGFEQTLGQDYMDQGAVQALLTNQVEEVQSWSHQKISLLADSTQLAIDELYLNHVAVPGIINALYDPKEKFAEERSPTRKGAVQKFPVGQKVLTKRAQLLNKFKERGGIYNSLPDWIKKLDLRVDKGLEDTLTRFQKNEQNMVKQVDEV